MHIALFTEPGLPDGDADDHPLATELRRRGVEMSFVVWSAGADLAWVDGVIRAGVFALMELELIDPQCYLALAPEAAGRFADAILGRLRG